MFLQKFFVYLIATGFLLAAAAKTYDLLQKLGTKWASVQGTVVSADPGEGREIGSGAARVTYCPSAKYFYAVNGRQWNGDNLYEDNGVEVSKSKAYQLMDWLEPGMAVTVHYDVENPAISYLVESSNRSYLFQAILAACAGTGLLFAARIRPFSRTIIFRGKSDISAGN